MEATGSSPLNRIHLYVRDRRRVADFYEKHFGFIRDEAEMPGMLRLFPRGGGCALALLQAGKGQRAGQSCVKLVFDVEDVDGMKARCAEAGLAFGVTHRAEGYVYANARDPAGNAVQISNKTFRA